MIYLVKVVKMLMSFDVHNHVQSPEGEEMIVFKKIRPPGFHFNELRELEIDLWCHGFAVVVNPLTPEIVKLNELRCDEGNFDCWMYNPWYDSAQNLRYRHGADYIDQVGLNMVNPCTTWPIIWSHSVM